MPPRVRIIFWGEQKMFIVYRAVDIEDGTLFIQMFLHLETGK